MVGTPRTYIHRYQRRFWYKMLGSRYLLWVTPVSTRICLCGELPVASQRTAHYSDSVLGIQYGTVRTWHDGTWHTCQEPVDCGVQFETCTFTVPVAASTNLRLRNTGH